MLRAPVSLEPQRFGMACHVDGVGERAADVAAFQGYVLGLPEVMRLYHVAGADDFLVHVGVRDSDALRDFAMNALTTRPEVAHLETGLIFSCVEAGDE